MRYNVIKGGKQYIMQKVKAKIKGTFWGTAIVKLDNYGTIVEVEEVEELEDFDNCEVKEIIYEIG